MKKMYFSKVDVIGIRIDWLCDRVNNFIGVQRQRKTQKWWTIVPAIETGENDDDDDVTLVADKDYDDDGNQNQNYLNAIDSDV